MPTLAQETILNDLRRYPSLVCETDTHYTKAMIYGAGFMRYVEASDVRALAAEGLLVSTLNTGRYERFALAPDLTP